MVNKLEVVHRAETIGSVKWHWIEAGEGDPVVLLHGIPESWQCWKHQIPTLATQFKVFAFDLKGYGQSDKSPGDYTMHNVAAELIKCLDLIGVKSFRLAGHDWGVAIGDHIVDQIPIQIERYLRCCLSLHNYDPRNSLHHIWNAHNPKAATRLMQNAEAYVRVWFDSSCKPGLRPDETEISEIVTEFSHPGIADAVPRYFRDIPKTRPVDYTKFTMPIVQVHGEYDPRQPIDYCRGMEDHLPGLEAVLVLEAGHFVTRERPLEMTQALMWFFNSMLASGLPLFDRSRHYGLPTKPTKPLAEKWGVNTFARDV